MKKWTTLLCLLVTLLTNSILSAAPVRVLVWDERQAAQKQVYTNFLGNEIAAHLEKVAGLSVKSSGLDEPQQGLADLDNTDVLIWWGHQRHTEITQETARGIVKRVKEGKLSLLSLHSAHWSQPFVEAMHERARMDALAMLPAEQRANAKIIETNLFANFRSVPKYDSMLTPAYFFRKPTGGSVEILLTLPNCCFPSYRADGKPSRIHVLEPNHPIVQGVPKEFTIEQTEMYNEAFHVPKPDTVLFEETWATGEWFRSGSIWNLGEGKVMYFRPGHETYGVFKNPNVLKIIENSALWLGEKKSHVR